MGHSQWHFYVLDFVSPCVCVAAISFLSLSALLACSLVFDNKHGLLIFQQQQQQRHFHPEPFTHLSCALWTLPVLLLDIHSMPSRSDPLGGRFHFDYRTFLSPDVFTSLYYIKKNTKNNTKIRRGMRIDRGETKSYVWGTVCLLCVFGHCPKGLAKHEMSGWRRQVRISLPKPDTIFILNFGVRPACVWPEWLFGLINS